MSLVTVPGKIAMLVDHTLIVMANDDRHQAVCISSEVLPIEDHAADRLAEYLGLFEEIATEKLDGGQIAYDGMVWITQADIPDDLPSERH